MLSCLDQSYDVSEPPRHLAMSRSVLEFVNRGINPQTAVIDFASGPGRGRVRRRRSRFPLYLSLSLDKMTSASSFVFPHHQW